MSILQFDSVGGASGDMILGALVDLGVDVETLRAGLASLPIGEYTIKAEPCEDHHLNGTKVSVVMPHEEGHVHRGLADIRELIHAGDLPAAVRDKALQVFERLAEAEAKVHRTTPEKIHFHEVGAVDALVDIVGSCLALHDLGVEAVAVGPLPLGCGTVKCAHGVYPVPAPATVELLRDMPVVKTDEPYELVTPTGAALLGTWRTDIASPVGSTILRAGYGFGQRCLTGRPNVLRATLLEGPVGTASRDTCRVLECNVDDTVPELIGHLLVRLIGAGALDAFTVSAQMKKQRPGTLLTVLCTAERRPDLLDLIFRECTTFGVREYEVDRTILDRRHEEVSTPYGPVRIKIGRWRGEDVTFAPEMDDCVARAEEQQVAARVVYESAAEAARSLRA